MGRARVSREAKQAQYANQYDEQCEHESERLFDSDYQPTLDMLRTDLHQNSIEVANGFSYTDH